MAGCAKGIARRKVGVFGVRLLLVGIGLANTPAAAVARHEAPTASTTALASGSGIRHAGTKGGRLSWRLLALSRDPLRSASDSAQAAALSLPSSGAGSLVRHRGGRVVVQVRMSDLSAAAIGRLTAHGVDVISTDAGYGTVTGAVPLGALGAIANDPDATYAAEVLAPRLGAHRAGRPGFERATGC